MKEFTISKKEAGQRMDKFVLKVLDQAPKSFVYKMIRKKNIVLNDKKATGQEVLKERDCIKIYFSDETFEKFASAVPIPKGISEAQKKENQMGLTGNRVKKTRPDLVYEDEDILIINKPAGLLSQKATENDYSANEMIIDYLLESGQLTEAELRTFHPSVCNRLDRNTSGLLIAGKTIRGLQQMAEQLKSRTMKKYYRTLVWGRVTGSQHLTGYLVKNHKTNQVEIHQNEPGDYIETAYRPIAYYGNGTLLEVHLITGRSHQIRAHLASIGHPILGDGKYGNASLNRKLQAETHIRGQLLHSYRMEFPDGRIVKADEPESFAKAGEWMKQREK